MCVCVYTNENKTTKIAIKIYISCPGRSQRAVAKQLIQHATAATSVYRCTVRQHKGFVPFAALQ